MNNKNKRIFAFDIKFIDFINKNIIMIYFFIACLLVIFIRIHFIYVESGDYVSCLLPWFNKIKENGGFASLNMTIGNYNVLYMYMFTALTYLPIEALYSIKLLSILFDILLGIACSLLIYQLCGRNSKALKKSLITFIVVLMLPTVILNASAWAQCDCAYTAFIILSLYSLLRDKPAISMIWFSIAFCLKLQAVFILPLFLILYFTNKKFSILHFLIIPAVNVIVSLPAVIAGRPICEIFKIYFQQIATYQRLTLNYPNIYEFLPNDYEAFSSMGIIMTIFIFGSMAVYIISQKYSITGLNPVLLSLWSVTTCVLFLPAMHERYAYIADIISVVYFIAINKKIIIPILVNFVSLMAYMPFLFGVQTLNVQIVAFINIISYTMITIELLNQLKNSNNNSNFRNTSTISLY